MPRRLLALTLAALAAFALTAPRARGAVMLTANLTKDQEGEPAKSTSFLTSTGASRPASSGTATFIINDAQTQMTMSATVFNIDVTGAQTPDTFDNLVAAHIHAPAPAGTNTGIVWGFFGTPDNDTNPDNLVVTPFATGVGGTFTSTWDQPEGNAGTTLTAQLTNLRSGLAYINFHTTQFGGGEIRGQILPEPTSLGLLGVATLGLLARRRRPA